MNVFNIKDSYITPIILSYVDKYIRDIRLEDTQVSLWSGEAVFHNLNLRLDVLEQELASPFTFVSGQIHELAISVPWTKLQSEPIKITINTIECVLKLKNYGTDNLETSTVSSTGSREARNKAKKQEMEAAPGYVQSLVNKIVSNITIECNNVILKYLEEDMVLSLNVRSLLLQSANESWQPTFAEMTPAQLILRKLVTLHDLTVCLDRRNSLGKIEFYEEPLLYRCSLEIRMSRTYTNMAASQAKEMKIDIKCNRMDFSISDQQMPMLLRILRLNLAWYLGELKELIKESEQSATTDENNDELVLAEEGGESWMGWAWSLVPSLTLVDEEYPPEPEDTDHVLMLGFYIDSMSVVFKLAASSLERCYYGTKKVKFTPLVGMELQGCFMEGAVVGLKAVNVTTGASHMVLKPMGEACSCGVEDLQSVFLAMGSPCDNYVTNSMFSRSEKEERELASWEEHLTNVTEGALLFRTPAFAMDYRYLLDLSDGVSNDFVQQFEGNLEHSNLPERALCRIVVGPMQLNVTSGLIHRVQEIMKAAGNYNYPPYVDPPPDPILSGLAPPSETDAFALEQYIPIRAYQLTMFKPVVNISYLDHPEKSRRRRTEFQGEPPYLSFECQCLDATHVKPMYPIRVVTTTCQIAAPSENLFTNCHRHSNIKLLSVSCNLVTSNNISNLLLPCHLTLSHKYLLYPHLWPRDDLSYSDWSFDSDHIILIASKQHYLTAQEILMFGDGPVESEDISLPYLEVILRGLSLHRVQSAQANTDRLQIKSCQISTPNIQIFAHKEEPLITATLQHSHTGILPNVVVLNVGKFVANLDQDLLNWITFKHPPGLRNDKRLKKKSVKSGSVGSKTTTQRQESFYSSELLSSKSSSAVSVTMKNKFLKFYKDWNCAFISLDVSPALLHIPVKKDQLILTLPSISFKSANQRQGIHILLSKLPIIFPSTVWRSDKDTFPWSLIVSSLSCDTVCNTIQKPLIHSVSANCTIGVSKPENSIGLCIHIDTPLLQIDLSPEQVGVLMKVLQLMGRIFKSRDEQVGVKVELQPPQPLQTPPATITAPSIHQQPMSVGSISEPSTYNMDGKMDKDGSVKVTAWVQWTLARILLNVYSADGKFKIACDMEDMMTSLDLQHIYLKIKSRITSASIQHYQKDPEEWRAGEHLGLIVRCNDDTLSSSKMDKAQASKGLIEVTFTRAQSSNVHRKWTQQVARSTPDAAPPCPSGPRYISEVDIKLCPLDVILSASVFQNFISLVEPVIKSPSGALSLSSPQPIGYKINNNTLPLVYFDIKDLRLFLPSKMSSPHDFCIVQLSSIHLVPHVENPLSRVYIRPDIYQMAQQANILSVPGSQVEDRQYQLDIKSLSVETGMWTDFERFIQVETISEPLSENPAAEWNKESFRNSELSLLPLVQKFDVSFMAAPAVVYQELKVGEVQRDLLVCGHSAEINATSDINLNISTNQISLITNLGFEWLTLVGAMTGMLTRYSESPDPGKILVPSDSGIEDQSSVCSPPIRKISKEKNPDLVPLELLVTAKSIKLVLYKNQVEEKVEPLLHMLFSQPHLVLALHSLKQRIEISCFDLALRTSNSISQQNQPPGLENFGIPLLQTKGGDPHPKTGVPPSVLTLTWNNFLASTGGKLKIDIGRPIHVQIGQHAWQLYQKLSKLLPQSTKETRNTLPRRVPIDFLQHKIDLSTSQLVLTLKLGNHKELIASLASISGEVQPKISLLRGTGSVKAHLDVSTFLIKAANGNRQNTLVNPWSLACDALLTWDSWFINLNTPRSQLFFDCDCLIVDIGQDQLECLRSLTKICEQLKEAPPPVEATQHRVFEETVVEEHYSDDIRAGAFQFLDAKGSEVPQPYQILFATKPASMTWRYPHPRALTKVHIYPVPFEDDIEEIPCQLQFLSDSEDCFKTLLFFRLSSSHFHKLDLPFPKDKQHSTAASVWRVLLEPSSPCLSPRAFAACLKVDSYFNPAIVPQSQCLIKLSTLRLNLVTQNSKFELSQPYSQFVADGTTPDQLPLATFVLNDSSVSLMQWPKDIKVEFETRAHFEVVDLATLTSMYVIDPFVAEGRIFKTSKEEHSLTEVSLLFHPILVKFGPAAGHTLMTAAQLWKDSNKVTRIIPARILVCNDAARIIIFKQADTSEEIILGSRQCNFYAWKSAAKKHQLQTKMALSQDAWSASSTVDNKERVEFIRDTKLVMRTVPLSATQTAVIYMGQLMLSNTLRENLEVQVKGATESNGEIFTLNSNSTCASVVIEEEKEIVLKVRFQSLASTWSGDIPLRVNKNTSMPWLAKVPLQDKGQFLSIWCRIFVQQCDGYKRYLAVFSPLYSVRSLLPTPILLSINTPGLQVEMSMKIEGRGSLHELYCPGTVEHSHKATILPLSSTVDEATAVPLSYGMTQIPADVPLEGEEVDIDKICSNIHKLSERRWPFVSEDIDFIECTQPPAKVKVSYELEAPHYTTLVLQLRPWALFVNCLPLDTLGVVCQDWNNSCVLPPGSVIVPPMIEGTFQICNELSATPALQLANEEWNSNFYMPRISGVVPREGSINTTINLADNKMFLLTLTSEVIKEENNLRALSIHPTVLISSSSEVVEKSIKLKVMPVVLPSKAKSLKLPSTKSSLLIDASATKPTAITQWHQLATALPSSDLLYYILIADSSQTSGWTCPLAIPMPGAIEGCASRHSFSIGTHSMVLTTHFRNRQVFAAISVEREPQLIIHNSCQFPLIFGQANIDKGKRSFSTMEECENILWRNDLAAGASRSYMMPTLQQSFPELQAKPSVLALLIALGTNQVFSFLGDIAWSEPITVSCCGHAEQFVRLPGHGDVRVRSHSISGGTTYLYIECVSRIEISAKEIRARLQPNPDSSVQILEHDDKRCLEADLKIIPEWQSNSPKSHLLLTCYARSVKANLTSDNSKYSVELLALTLDNIFVKICPMSGASRELKVAIGDIQLDNQKFFQGGFDFPVIFKGQNGLAEDIIPMRMSELKSASDRLSESSLLNFIVVQETWIFTTMKSLNISLKPVNLFVEDTMIMEMSKLAEILNVTKIMFVPNGLAQEKTHLPIDVVWEVQQAANPLQIHRFSLEPVSLVVSVHTSLKVFIALDRSPLNFSAFERHRICTTNYHLGHELTRHYLSGALFKAGWMVGSLEILGSPGAFVLTVGSGIRDFVCLPFTGILQGPWGFVNGVTHGSASLMKHLTAGTLSSITNLASSMARNLDRCSFDQEHVERAEEARRQRSPQGIGQGVIQGLSSLGISLLGAISGIAHHPLQAIMHQNSSPLSGLVTGVGLGLVGVITKPLSGAAEFVALTGQGLLHGAGWSSLPMAKGEASIESSSNRMAAQLQHTWKSSSLDDPIVMAIDATLEQDGALEAVVLMLSTQYFMVVVQETEQIKNLIPVTDLKPKMDEKDPTLLSVAIEQLSSNAEVEDYPQARVEDFVRHSSMTYIPESTTNIDGNSTPYSSFESENSENLTKPLNFFINPQLRKYFHSVLVLAQRQAQNRGFAVL
ncbi:intermembrane lipid transfer protein VPS13B isoform X2 [Neocloeon triangulifer]|uniref:intermembrane lipid transfer protein VPS13B isoform X2 n=1 Tax=Neocloeon triangulifer TaxID=2078957 RepID=UPI00286F8940|nr:intermembrane lipid transfer protein VPS13B isoform X2 [Neocloeon triangulifer]